MQNTPKTFYQYPLMKLAEAYRIEHHHNQYDKFSQSDEAIVKTATSFTHFCKVLPSRSCVLQCCHLFQYQMSSTSNSLSFIKRDILSFLQLDLPKVHCPKGTGFYLTTLDGALIWVPFDSWRITRDIVTGPHVARFCTTFWIEKPTRNWV